MTNYSFQQLEDIWVQAGGNAQKAAFAAAIALAESGGNPSSTNNNGNGTTDRGLWQINSIHGPQSTYDPMANAKAAVAISSNGSNWRPWCTAWSNGLCGGTFLGSGAPVFKHLPANAPTPSVTGNSGTTPPSSSSNQTAQPSAPTPVQTVSDGGIFGPLVNEVESIYNRIAIALWYGLFAGIGMLMMVGGIAVLASRSKGFNSIVNVGTAVVTKGKSLKGGQS